MEKAPDPAEQTWLRIQDGTLRAEDVPLTTVADAYGTPAYVYSRTAIESAYREIDAAISFAPRRMIAYAVKANGNLSVLNTLARLGSGVEVVSGGELARALRARVPASRIVMSGVGKTPREIGEALDAGVRCINMENEDEVGLLSSLSAERGIRARVSIRINPDIDAGAHPYIATGLHDTKFGLELPAAMRTAERVASDPNLELAGVSMHIGSQLGTTDPLEEAVAILGGVAARLLDAGHPLSFIDVGGGWPIRYGDETADFPTAAAFGEAIRRGLEASGLGTDTLELLTEPGRYLVGDAGVLLTRILSVKRTPKKRFVIVDAAMTELIRPALYGAYHEVLAVSPRPGSVKADLVGPVCETGDFLARDRDLPLLEAGDLVAIRGAGAYAREMASTYNGRVPAAEVMVAGDEALLVRRRPEYDEALWQFDEVFWD
jgi:diaminopimelate decarboxylase